MTAYPFEEVLEFPNLEFIVNDPWETGVEREVRCAQCGRLFFELESVIRYKNRKRDGLIDWTHHINRLTCLWCDDLGAAGEGGGSCLSSITYLNKKAELLCTKMSAKKGPPVNWWMLLCLIILSIVVWYLLTYIPMAPR